MEPNKKIRVGFLTERMLRGFGVDLVVDKTAKELIKEGFEVTVFCINSDGTFSGNGYDIVRIDSPFGYSPLRAEWNMRNALKRLNAGTKIDIWIAETYPFFMAPLVMDRPVIIVDHGVVLTTGLPLSTRLIFFYMKLVQNYIFFPKAAKVINISNFTQSLTPHFLRKKQLVIYNGADNYDFPKEDEISDFRKRHNLSERDFVMLYVGRINPKNQPYKGTEELVEMFNYIKKKNENVKLVMAGFGDDKDREWLESKGVIPFISADDQTLALLYSVADCYVTASKWEGFDLPLVEAAHFGVPYVAYKAGAHREVVNDKSGFLVENKSEYILRVNELIANREKRNLMAEAAKENAANFLWDKTGQKYKEVILKENMAFQAKISERKFKKKSFDEGVVDVITLNYNGKKFLDKLFESLKDQTYKKIRVTMVDNGSSDGSADYVEEKFPWVNVIRSEKNLFFSRGNNLAVSKTNGEYIFFVNNDVVVESDAIEKMVNLYKEKGKYGNVASIAPKMLFFNKKNIIDSVGVVITNSGAPFNRGIGQIDIGQYDKEEEIFGACFGAALIKRYVYESAVGPLDNAYFGYFEDVDWNYRAKIFGYKSYFCPDAIVYHDHSGTSKKFGYEWKYYLIHRNFLKTIIKNFQLRGMIFWGGIKSVELIRHWRETDIDGRRMTVIKIFLHVTCSLPALLIKRVQIQMKRCVSDYECYKFSENENSYFDPVNYEPILTLDTLQAMFTRLDLVKNFSDQELSDIVAKIGYLNKSKMHMNFEMWDRQVRKLILSTEKYIGSYYVKQFMEAIVEKKTWKK